jgi:hypothetical protein
VATFNNADSYIDSLPAIKCFYSKESTVGTINNYVSLWRSIGRTTAGIKPSSVSGSACNSVTIGSGDIPQVSGGKKNHLSQFAAFQSLPGILILSDRIIHTDSLVANTTSSQTINSISLPARAGTGEGVEIGIEIYTATGVTPYDVSVSYTNSSNVSGRTATASIIASAGANRFFPLSLQTGDIGVRSVQSLSCSVSSGTAGDIGVTFHKPIMEISISVSSIPSTMNFLETGLEEIHEDSCLWSYSLLGSTTSGRIEIAYDFVQRIPALCLFLLFLLSRLLC